MALKKLQCIAFDRLPVAVLSFEYCLTNLLLSFALRLAFKCAESGIVLEVRTGWLIIRDGLQQLFKIEDGHQGTTNLWVTRMGVKPFFARLPNARLRH